MMALAIFGIETTPCPSRPNAAGIFLAGAARLSCPRGHSRAVQKLSVIQAVVEIRSWSELQVALRQRAET